MRTDQRFASAPVAKSVTTRTSKPEMKTRPNGDAIIRHREYVADVIAGVGTPTGFDLIALAINPGQAATFPWLSKVAANYESYQFDLLKFCYETEAPTSLGGTLIMTLDYDASDSAPTTKQQAMAYRSAVRSAPWSPCEHLSLMEDLRKSKTNFVRPGPQPINTDIKTYDIGNLFLISQGVTTPAAAMGELYVEYSVRLMTPVYDVVPLMIVGGLVTGGGTITPENPFGNVPVVDAQAYGIAIDNKSVLSINQPGTYIISMNVAGVADSNITAITMSALGVTLGYATFLADGTGGTAVFTATVPASVDIPIEVTGDDVLQSSLIVSQVPSGSLG